MQSRNNDFFEQTTYDVLYNNGSSVRSISRPFSARQVFTVGTNVPWKPGENPHSFTKQYRQNWSGSLVRTKPGVGAAGFTALTAGIIGDLNVLRPDLIGNTSRFGVLRNAAVADIYEQLRSGDAGSGLDLSVSLAEHQQVRRMLGKKNQLLTFVLQKSPLYWAHNWLQFRYGVQPLMGDIYGLVDALINRRLTTMARITGIGKEHNRTTSYGSSTVFPGSREVQLLKSSYIYEITCLFEIKNTTRQIISGYTSMNPVSIAWELTRLSFVVDWFYDIGGYLRSVEGAMLFGTGFKEGFELGSYMDVLTGYVDGNGIVGGDRYTGSSNTGGLRRIHKTRSPVGAFPFPTLPRFEANLGASQLLDAASLLAIAGFGTPRPRMGETADGQLYDIDDSAYEWHAPRSRRRRR